MFLIQRSRISAFLIAALLSSSIALAGTSSSIYVDPAIADDTGEGNQPLNITFLNASYDHTGNGEGERHLSLTSAFASYTFTAGDLFFLQNAVGGVADGLYEVASRVDDDAILLVADGGLTADSTTDVDSGSPFGDVEWAVEQTLFDTTNGTQVNIKTGTLETLAADLSVAMADTVTTVAWVTSEAAPLTLRGYGTKIGDDVGKGALSGGGSVSIIDDVNLDNIHIINIDACCTGSNDIFQLDNGNSIIDSDIHDTTGRGLDLDANNFIQRTKLYDIQGQGISIDSGYIGFSTFSNGTKDFSAAVTAGSSGFVILEENLFNLDGASDGILMKDYWVVQHNSIFSNGGTGQGLIFIGTGRLMLKIANNLIEGFSGVGGVCIDTSGTNNSVLVQGANSVEDCETDFTGVGDKLIFDMGGDEELSGSPFTNAPTDFSPVDIGLVKEGARPTTFPDPTAA